ncbi:MAG: hypothetical protein PHP22_11605, partial [Oscillospiraceae bacterium]|nr:hypothetical protein [Oscillospiraceae bacterium]
MISDFIITNVDREILGPLIQRLPDKIFDIDSHIYRMTDIGEQSEPYHDGPSEVTVDEWKTQMSPLIGKPPEGGLHLTPPTEKEDQLPAANRFLISQLKTDPARRGVVM